MRKILEPGASMSNAEQEQPLEELLDLIQEQGRAQDNFLGLLHVLIGRRIEKEDGTLISNGMSWRQLATMLKERRWDREAVRQLDIDPDELPPRDRNRFWFLAISRAGVDSDKAVSAGNYLADLLQDDGYVVGPAPTQ